MKKTMPKYTSQSQACSPSECLETNIYEIWGYRIQYPAMNLEKWNLESEKWNPEPKK